MAVLGPTNTGKTTYAIERMLAHRTGVIGLPLRLLAREVYDRIVALRGPSVVGLVTGEERIVPPRTQYWVCTVEAMPEGMGCDFLAIDEIQLCADPERGHVFTDRLLRSRGQHETLFLGSDTMRGAIADLVPQAQFMRRDRMSDLTYSGPKKISRMKPRSAIVGFSVENVYAIAELIRRQKGGAAVVMGALSPRTRNAQVDMYQNGEVDYLVATDAIGMGLNLDVDHVAFSALSKFDGRRMRPLAPNELAQIAGRAGRGLKNGTFGVTGEARPLDEGVAQAIMDHRFTPQSKSELPQPCTEIRLYRASDHVARSSPQITNGWSEPARRMTSKRSNPCPISPRWRRGPRTALLSNCCGMSAACRTFAGSVTANTPTLRQRFSTTCTSAERCRKTGSHGRSNASIARTGTSTRLSKRLAFIRTWTYVSHSEKAGRGTKAHWRGDDTRS